MSGRWPGRAGAWLAALGLGIGNAVLIMGPGPIDPGNTAWLFGDTATYYVGWALYRHDPDLSFPLAWTDRVGYPAGTSIALLDAIPLVAIVLRPFSAVLPEPFQYLGLYTVLCFVLQAYFGMRIWQRLCPSHPRLAAIAGVFFLLSPPLAIRAGGHTALASQWVILAALDAYLRDPGARPARWMARLWVVLAIAGGINPYIAFMCVLVVTAGPLRLWLERRWGWMRTVGALAATGMVLVASLLTFGVLIGSSASTYWAEGYGTLSMNLNALVNPMRPPSLLPTLRVAYPGQLEGYNYLGAGVLALLVCAAAAIARRPALAARLVEPRFLPLAGLGVVCTLLAVSTTVTLGPSTLLTIPLPPPVLTAMHGLRASGRLFWPAYYLIVAGALALAFRLAAPRITAVVLCAALALQIVDLSPMRRRIRQSLDQRFESPLQSPAWTGLGRNYENLILVPPFQCGPEQSVGGIYSYVWFGKLAAAERMRTNDYYAARYTREQMSTHCVDLLRAQLAGTLDSRSAYVVTDGVRTLWSLGAMRSHRCARVDGFNLCTPDASGGAAPEETAAPAAPAYAPGSVLDLAAADSQRYLVFGWGDPESDGTWTRGPVALVRLGLDAVPDRPLVLEVDAEPSVGPRHPRLEVEVAVNGQAIDRWIFEGASAATRRQARIPAAAAAARRGLDVELRVRNPAPGGFRGLKVRSLAVRRD